MIKDGKGKALDTETKREITFKAGEYNIEVTVKDAGGEQRFVTDHFVLTRNGKKIVHARWETAKPMPTIEPSIPDRRAAEYVWSIGGGIGCEQGGREQRMQVGGKLPASEFALTLVDLSNNTQVTDDGLAVFEGCKNLTTLQLSNRRLSDAGLTHFKDCTNLTYLGLALTQVTDAGLMQFQDCKKLTTLSLGKTQVSDVGLSHFRNCRNLTYLNLQGTKVTDAGLAYFQNCTEVTYLSLYAASSVGDAGLAHLGNCQELAKVDLTATQVSDAGLPQIKAWKSLQELVLVQTKVTDAGLEHVANNRSLQTVDISRTKVSEAGVKKLAAALPACRIEWDGGVVERSIVADPDRRAAEWVLSIPREYQVAVQVNDVDHWIGKLDALPVQPFRLTAVNIEWASKLDDAGLAYFAGCPNLEKLELFWAPVSDAGLAHFKDCKNLKSVDLGRVVQVTDEGLANFAGWP